MQEGLCPHHLFVSNCEECRNSSPLPPHLLTVDQYKVWSNRSHSTPNGRGHVNPLQRSAAHHPSLHHNGTASSHHLTLFFNNSADHPINAPDPQNDLPSNFSPRGRISSSERSTLNDSSPKIGPQLSLNRSANSSVAKKVPTKDIGAPLPTILVGGAEQGAGSAFEDVEKEKVQQEPQLPPFFSPINSPPPQRHSKVISKKTPTGKMSLSIPATKTSSIKGEGALSLGYESENQMSPRSPRTPKEMSIPPEITTTFPFPEFLSTRGPFDSPGRTESPIELHEVIGPYDKRFAPPYRRFKWHIYWLDKSNQKQLFDLQSTHKLNKAMERDQNTVKLTIKGRKYLVDFLQMKQFSDAEPSKARSIFIKARCQMWYYRDSDGVIKPYDVPTVAEITNKILRDNLAVFQIRIGKHEYEIDIVHKTQHNILTRTERQIFQETDLEKMRVWEVNYDEILPPQPGMEYSMIELNENSTEFQNISEYFYMHMPKIVHTSSLVSSSFRISNRIIRIRKIFNPKLRDQWTFLLKKIREDNNNNDPTFKLTKLLWHGSGDLSPSIIYSDVHYGWKINYSSAKNLWGQGLYFGEDASYCHKYAFRNQNGNRELFLAEVITGDDIISLEDMNIKEPSLKEDGKTRYDSVCGVRHETSWIWVVYASGRAYPSYLVEYED